MPPNPSCLGFPDSFSSMFQTSSQTFSWIRSWIRSGSGTSTNCRLRQWGFLLRFQTWLQNRQSMGWWIKMCMLICFLFLTSFIAPFPVDAFCDLKVMIASDCPYAFQTLCTIHCLCIFLLPGPFLEFSTCLLVVLCKWYFHVCALPFEPWTSPNAKPKVAQQGGLRWALMFFSFQPRLVLFGPFSPPNL